MNALIPHIFEDQLVRSVQYLDEPWFAGKDVCQALCIKDHNQALERLDQDERTGYIVPTPSGEQTMIIVSVPGVFRLIFTSRKAEAERFKRWLAHDVLPSLMKNGTYSLNEQPTGPAPFQFPVNTDRGIENALAAINTAARLYGNAAGRTMWRQLGLPVLEEQHTALIEDGKMFIALLRNCEADGPRIGSLIEQALSGDDNAQDHLKKFGVVVEAAQDAVIVANCHPYIQKEFQGTQFEHGWRRSLRSLPGTGIADRRQFGRHAARGTLVPVSYFDAER